MSGISITFLFFFTTGLFLPFYLGADFPATKIGIPGYGLFLTVWMGATQIGLMYEVVPAEMRMRDEAKLFALIDTFFNVGMVLMCIALGTFRCLREWIPPENTSCRTSSANPNQASPPSYDSIPASMRRAIRSSTDDHVYSLSTRALPALPIARASTGSDRIRTTFSANS